MREIRLRWSTTYSGRNDELKDGGQWHPDTPENRETFEMVMESGNSKFGPATHWIDERDASVTSLCVAGGQQADKDEREKTEP